VRDRPSDCWYNLIFEGLKSRLTKFAQPDGRNVWRIELKPIAEVVPSESDAKVGEPPPLPAWALCAAPRERSRPKLAPSRLSLSLDDDDAEMPDQPPLGPLALGESGRFARGLLVHALLQHLPEVEPSRQEQAAQDFVAARGADLTRDLQAEIVAESLAIVRDATFARLFQPGSLAEVSVAARIGGYDLEGQIDRLVQLDDAVLILDYKTNRPPPQTLEEVAPAYIAQLAGYRRALKGLLKDRALRAALLWTDGPRLMEIPSTSLDRAEEALLRRAADLDGMMART
jgi:ATP-dependent helicase/nuclease subunit A